MALIKSTTFRDETLLKTTQCVRSLKNCWRIGISALQVTTQCSTVSEPPHAEHRGGFHLSTIMSVWRASAPATTCGLWFRLAVAVLRTVDNWFSSMQFVVGFRVPGQLPFTFDIPIHAGVEVDEQNGDGSCGHTQSSFRCRIRRRVYWILRQNYFAMYLLPSYHLCAYE
jgi:hypothetical protein